MPRQLLVRRFNISASQILKNPAKVVEIVLLDGDAHELVGAPNCTTPTIKPGQSVRLNGPPIRLYPFFCQGTDVLTDARTYNLLKLVRLKTRKNEGEKYLVILEGLDCFFPAEPFEPTKELATV